MLDHYRGYDQKCRLERTSNAVVPLLWSGEGCSRYKERQWDRKADGIPLWSPTAVCSDEIPAGKTGTAENSGSDHANFICYAPYDEPEIAMAIMIEHGAKSWVAADAAEKMLSEYFGLEKDKNKTDIDPLLR